MDGGLGGVTAIKCTVWVVILVTTLVPVVRERVGVGGIGCT